MTLSTIKKPVSERALFARMNRKLVKDGVRLHRAKVNSKVALTLGEYYTTENNSVTAQFINLEDWAKEMNALKPWEVLDFGDKSEDKNEVA
jgi:hypothetical protein